MATGVIQPYPLYSNPAAIVQKTIESFVGAVRPMGPVVVSEMAPEEIAMAAHRVATAVAQGVAIPRYTDQVVVRAAKMILEGKPFVIKSAGRAAMIRVKSFEAR